MEVEESSDLPDIVVGMIIALENLGYFTRKAAELINSWGYKASHQSAWRIYTRYDKGESLNNRSNCGRTSIIGEKSKQKIMKAVLNDRHLTSTDIQRDESLNTHDLTRQSINNILIDAGLGAHKPAVVHFITEENKMKRKEWCKKLADWGKISFTDQSLIQASSFQIKWIRRYEGEILDEDYFIKKSKWNNGIRILVWGGIKIQGPQSLYFAEGTVNGDHYLEILDQCLEDFEGLEEGKLTFMQDNAPAHSKTKKFLEEMKITRLDWSAQSPDLNPIENICSFLKDKIWRIKDDIETKEQLIEAQEDFWWNDVELKSIQYRSRYLRIQIQQRYKLLKYSIIDSVSFILDGFFTMLLPAIHILLSFRCNGYPNLILLMILQTVLIEILQTLFTSL